MLRRRRAKARPADRTAVPARWRPVILDCDGRLGELQRLVDQAHEGPLRDRLGELRDGASAAVEEAVSTTLRAEQVQRLTETLDMAAITDAFKRTRREHDEAAQRGEVPAALAESLASLRRQHESANRLLNAVEQADERMAAVRARLTELVLSAAELTLRTGDDALEVAEQRARALADEAHALRAAFAEVD
jgi:hypothetical protein